MSSAQVGRDIFAALKGLVSNRVYPIDFPQSETLMKWPSIRYSFITNTPPVGICGDLGDDDSDIRVQIDVVHTGPDALRALREQVLVVMAEFDPPAINEDSTEVFDPDTKTYRSILEYTIYQ